MNRQPRPADRPRTLSSLESLVVCGAVGLALFLLGAAGALPGNAMRYLLQIFFVHPYEMEMDFYPQYAARMEVCRDALAVILQ